jgi:hypothetical protein
MGTAYELVRVGKSGTKLHALDPDDPHGRVFCETRTSSRLKHRLQDGSGGYSDHSPGSWSEIIPTGQRGVPACSQCLALVQRA